MDRPKKAKKSPRLVTCQKCKNKPCTKCKGTGKVKAINARSKGATFERKTATQISKWAGVKVTRTPLSGGFYQAGDLTPKDPAEMIRWPWNCELKKQESWHLEALIKDNKGQLPEWWKQCTRDAKKSKKVPLLVFTKNNDQVYAMMRLKDVKVTNLYNIIKQRSFKFKKRIIFLWEDFLKVSYKSYIKSYKRMVKDENRRKKHNRK